MEGWVCRHEIRDDGVYKDGVKIADSDAKDLIERFEHEQALFIGAKHRRVTEVVTDFLEQFNLRPIIDMKFPRE